MSASDNEAVAARAGTTPSWPQDRDCDAMSNSASDFLDVNPFVGEGGAYNSVRPAYPDEAVAALVDAARSGRGAHATGQGGPLRTADIGAGTGKMSGLLARAGLLVDAVEPSEAMRAQASSVDGVTWHDGLAEDTGLPNGAYDIVVFAQSWHWVDEARAGVEAARILAPGGALAIVWNQMAVSIPWVHRLTRIMRSGDVHRPDNPPTPGGGFEPMTLTQVAWEDRMTPEEILTLGTTRSSYIRSSEAGRERMQANLRWYLYDHLGYAPGELVTIPYATLVWLTHL